MTFKHIKFEDSMVMRSLEKLAHTKGLVKDEPVVKTASATNVRPTSGNLTENIIYLCTQLRTSGLESQAADIEQKLMAYKQANTLYETSSEKGEDLVDRAHPKGSYKLEGVEGGDLAIIETIIDQQLKNIKMVEKKPTGKLSNASDILKAVKVALGQDADPSQKLSDLKNYITSQLNTVYREVPASFGFIPPVPSSVTQYLDNFKDPSRIQQAREAFVEFYNRMKMGLGPKPEIWAEIVTILNPLGFKLTEMLNLSKSLLSAAVGNEPKATPKKETPEEAPFVSQRSEESKSFVNIIREYLNKLFALDRWISTNPLITDDEDKKAVTAWANTKRAEIYKIYNEFQKLDSNPDNQTAQIGNYSKLLAPHFKEIDSADKTYRKTYA